MYQRLRPITLIALLLTTLVGTGLSAKTLTFEEVLAEETPEVKPKRIYSKIARIVANGLPQAHINHAEVSDEVARKALDLYLDQLDYDRTFFMQADIDRLSENVLTLDDSLQNGQLQFAYDAFTLFRERLLDRAMFVNTLLEEDFDLDEDEDYLWKRKEAPRAENRKAWDQLWRKKIKNEFVAYKVNKILAEEEAARKAEEGTEEEEEEELDSEDKDTLNLTPEERIRKRYTQLLTVINGHDSEWVLQAYLNAFAQAYDAHTSYMSPRANEDFDINMKLLLTGIGAVLNVEDGAAKIVRLIAGGPAERDGRLQPGDKIVGVAQGKGEEEVDILYWPLYKSVRLIRGEKGSTVILTVVPASDVTGGTLKKIDLTREEIKLEDRAAKLDIRELPGEEGKVASTLGVITLPDFYADLSGIKEGNKESRSCSRDVKRLLEEANEAKVDGLILDLRNNGGGSLQEAVELTGHFIDRGPVVQVKGNRRVNVLRDPNSDVLYGGPLIVLVNRMSASASEILAGALQDHGRALVIGDTKTHGKGTVQSVFPLDRFNPELGALKVTTAGFYRVDGRSTQLKGVEPDIVMPSAFDVMEIGEEFLTNVLDWSWVAAADYEPEENLSQVITNLRQRSEERRAENEQYETYERLVNRLDERTQMKTIPLQLDKRIALARKDKELDDLQKRLGEELSGLSMGSPGDDEEEIEKKNRDVILNETLFILRDLVEELDDGTPHEVAVQAATSS